MTEPTLFAESGFLRLRLDIAYDGTNFSGWSKQPGRRTVQSELESALQKLTRVPVETIVAGRTDAGVHATGQVVHVDIPDLEIGPYSKKDDWNIDELPYRLNRILDEDVRILSASIAPVGFHARFSALRRYYQYKIVDNNRPVLPMRRFDVASWYRPLDVDVMNQASALLVGENDFAAFCKFRQGGTTIRTLEKFSWVRSEEGLKAEIVADAFCYSMVRNLVGAVVCVADGRFPADWVKEVLDNRKRVSDSLVFPSRGLTLVQVDYPSEDQLLARIEATLRRRDEEE
ncbi:MAG: tRNA pseudouridine(38-40) synthase TruA [Candidatus Nanopelagicaceae bacterium]|nr:tRNA pseudouridine(38-40) synthase TruA [Candidatus Nanopelagicaceae bacterium]